MVALTSGCKDSSTHSFTSIMVNKKKMRLVGGFDWLECFQFALAIGSVIGTASGLQKPVPVIPKLLILKQGQKLKAD